MAKKITLPDSGEFTLVLIDEDKPTVDGRVFEPGQVTWRDPPVPLMYLTENIGDGHKGSKVGGQISEIWRDGTRVLGKGRFDSGDNGQELRRLITEGTLTGVSSDVGGAVLQQELAEDGSQQARIVKGQIMGATVLPFPAFDDTRVAVVASAVPAEPPADWFNNPRLSAPQALTITRDGQVFGHAALWKTCHIGRPGTCLTPPHSPSDYAYFRTGSVLTADGATISTGAITLGTGHAGLTLGAASAAEHYDHTGTAIADVVVGEDQHGIWVAGAIRPGVGDDRLRELRASALSGDWRTISGRLDLVALLAVNVPGFPVPRTRATFANESPLALVAAGVASDDEITAQAREDLSMKTDMSKPGEMHKDPRHDHPDPTKPHNVASETPHNVPGDLDSEPITEANAASKRTAVKEFGVDGDEMVTDEDIALVQGMIEEFRKMTVGETVRKTPPYVVGRGAVKAARKVYKRVFSAIDEDDNDEAECVECAQTLTIEEQEDFTARLDAVEAALIGLASRRLETFNVAKIEVETEEA